MDKKYLMEVAEFQVARWWGKMTARYPSIGPVPRVVLNNRLKTTAGRAWLDDHYIDLSTELFWQHTERFVVDTIPHELAHLVAFKVHGDRGHGVGWKSVVKHMGIATTRCHNMVNSSHAKK